MGTPTMGKGFHCLRSSPPPLAPECPPRAGRGSHLGGSRLRPPASPAPRPGGDGDRRWCRRWGRLARWVPVPWVGTGGGNHSSPPLASGKGSPRLTGATDVGGGRGGRRRGRPATPHLPTQPSPPRSRRRVGAGLGISWESGQGARGSRRSGCSRSYLGGAEPPPRGCLVCRVPPPKPQPPRHRGRTEAGRRMVQEPTGPTLAVTGRPSSTATPPGHSNTSLLLGCTRPPL